MRKLVLLIALVLSLFFWKANMLEPSTKDAPKGDLIHSDITGLFEKLEVPENNTLEKKRSNSINSKQSKETTPQVIDVPNYMVNHAEELLFNTGMVSILKENIDLVSVWDKLTVASIAWNNFTMDEMNTWKDKLSDGVTVVEREEFNKLVFDRLSESDIAKLTALTEKYLNKLPENQLAEVETIVEQYVNQ